MGGLIDFSAPQVPKAAKAVKEKKEELAPAEKKDSPEQQYLQIYEQLLINVAKTESLRSEGLLDFLLVFREIYNKDFFSDNMTTTLMREIYLDTQVPDQKQLKELQALDQEQSKDRQVIKKLESHEIYAAMYGEKDEDFVSAAYQKGKGNIAKLGQWDSRKCTLALFTVNQDVIIDELKERFGLEENASWDRIRDLCMPVWVKDSYKLRNMVEWIAKVAYKIATEQSQKNIGGVAGPISKAEATSLWYILMNKKTMLINLYEKEISTGGDKVAGMLNRDFTVDRWRKAALKNAMVLRQKQRFLLSATFLILGDDIPGALQVIKQGMADPILAILICRMLILQQPSNAEIPKYLDGLYEEYFIARGRRFRDVNLISIGLWNQKKYVEAVNALQEARLNQNGPDVNGSGIEFMFEQDNGYQFNQDVVEVPGKFADNGKDHDKIKGGIRKDQYLPVVHAHTGYDLITMINKLKKAPLVTQALKKDEGNTGYGADGGDLFDDFMGGPSTSTKKKEEEAKEKAEAGRSELEINSSLLLN